MYFVVSNLQKVIFFLDSHIKNLLPHVFGWKVATLYKCVGHPCPNTVDCFVSRPLEKEFVQKFLYVTTYFSLLLCFLDLWWQLFVYMRKLCCRRRLLEKSMVACELSNLRDLDKYLNKSNHRGKHDKNGKGVHRIFRKKRSFEIFSDFPSSCISSLLKIYVTKNEHFQSLLWC